GAKDARTHPQRALGLRLPADDKKHVHHYLCLTRRAENKFTVYYVQASYRLGDRWEVMVRFDSLVSDRDDRDGEAFAAATERPAFTRFAQDWTVGLRWDVTRQFMVRAEYHHVDGTAWLPLEDNPNLGSLAPHWDIFALLASFRF
ncbi:MAG: hypothetical protein ACREX4_18760, partial [Gammaproteobacteria bacterium]